MKKKLLPVISSSLFILAALSLEQNFLHGREFDQSSFPLKREQEAREKSHLTAKELEELEEMGWKVEGEQILPLSQPYDSQHVSERKNTLPAENPLGRGAANEGFSESLIAEASPSTSEVSVKQPLLEPPVKEELAVRSDQPQPPVRLISINFNNVHVVEYIRFVSRISGKNFIFDEADLDFNITVIAEEATTVENVLAALFQELRVHELTILEEGNNILIHKNPNVSSISTVGMGDVVPGNSELVTQVFYLNSLAPAKAAAVIRPLTSAKAIVEILENSNNLIVTDLTSNVRLIAKLLKSLDAPAGGVVLGQYVVKNSSVDTLVELIQQIMLPIAQEQQLTFVPQPKASSIFIVSSPYLVEKSISMLQRLDQKQGTTRIYEMKDLKVQERAISTAEGVTLPGIAGENQAMGGWDLDPQGNWVFKPSLPQAPENSPKGTWYKDKKGNWFFVPEGLTPPPSSTQETLERVPKGRWEKDLIGDWTFRLGSGESISAEPIFRNVPLAPDLPLGDIERTKFFIHKLQYRKGADIQQALSLIGASLDRRGQSNEDLVATINTVQWLESSNSLIFTGTVDAIRKLEELIGELDTPLRQVFIEMLILDTTLDDSLQYGVNWGTRFGDENVSGSQAFLSDASTLPGALDTSGIRSGALLSPNASSLARVSGFNLGVIGQSVSLGKLTFNSIGALVKAIHDKINTNIIMNPKILTEDNVTAEVFVGYNTPFQTQSISNVGGTPIANNFEFRNVGTTFKVTPFLGNSNVVTLEIREEVSSVASTSSSNVLTSSLPGPTTRLSRTTTRVHVPDKYFLVLSGMMQDEETRRKVSVPCLGGLPLIGAAFNDKTVGDTKRNIMIFIRPQIIDTEEEVQKLTKHQQDIFRYKNETKKSWKFEVDEALDFFNIKSKEPYQEGSSCETFDRDCS
ncbi:secretin N-terminal domain-containing protein [Parachlamydia sp. AcF125]|uniref:secretin N-terminal domain-containing protein n=1 Tax=Parachlamydia sp. AcF125 TaxID=2795736 RepID=UPI001BD8C04D|nr:secretin N-terminal domain-containing protein [Parachlamydia sp. AcF125]MBS4168172.1 Type II secretion system protein D [Parachlamydia sp. AcF125]